MTEMKRIAVIRIKGKPGLRHDIKETFNKLRLYNKNTCVIIPNTASYVGMLEKIRNDATWGEVDLITCQELLTKRGKLPGNKKFTDEYAKEKINKDIKSFTEEFINFKKEIKDVPGLKNFFKLSPPRKGFERKGIKVPFSQGGVLGYRKGKINDLLKRMI
ncbi:MAG: 50S ribosomal protein L30 [Nanoarchaeota archaeon]|nr:50S ribosomal protein L30 [Nanoarchaeota archaeon]